MPIGIGGSLGPFRAGVSTRGVGGGLGCLSVGAGWGGCGSLLTVVAIFVAVGWIIDNWQTVVAGLVIVWFAGWLLGRLRGSPKSEYFVDDPALDDLDVEETLDEQSIREWQTVLAAAERRLGSVTANVAAISEERDALLACEIRLRGSGDFDLPSGEWREFLEDGEYAFGSGTGHRCSALLHVEGDEGFDHGDRGTWLVTDRRISLRVGGSVHEWRYPDVRAVAQAGVPTRILFSESKVVPATEGIDQVSRRPNEPDLVLLALWGLGTKDPSVREVAEDMLAGSKKSFEDSLAKACLIQSEAERDISSARRALRLDAV